MESETKLKSLILYVLTHQAYKEGGIKKLNKLLYFIDFYFYREHERLISGAKYAKAPMGPVLDHYESIFSELERTGDVKCQSEGSMTICRALKSADLSNFTPEEIDHIARVLDRYGRLPGSDLEWISHQQQPWLLTENFGDIIDPDLSLLIEDDKSESETSIVKDPELRKELEDLANRTE